MGSSNQKSAYVKLSDRARRVCRKHQIKGDFWIGLSLGVSLKIMSDNGLENDFLVLLNKIAKEAKEALGPAHFDSLKTSNFDTAFTRKN